MNPYLSWAILLVVAGGLGWYYTNGGQPKAKAAVKAAVEKTEATVVPKKQKRSKPKAAPEPAKKPMVKTVVSPPTTEDEKPDEDIDQKEMARRLAGLKNGTSQTAAKGEKKKKSKKAAAAVPLESNASSTTGADADDDLSPAVSPVVNAAPAAGYVSDMLEAPAPGSSVLRVTGNVQSEPKKQKAQTFKQVETKKQRQNRLKNEARKEQVQEAEGQRRKLLEKQMHSARESERQTAARSTPPPSNAWQTKEVNGASRVAPTSAPVELLDTFDPAPAAPAPKKWAQDLPSEEEQMRMLGAHEVEDEWTTVSKKQPKKKGSKAEESVSDTSESQPTPAAPMPVEPRVTVTPTYLPDILQSSEKGHPLDSDWAA
ncbi:uncharacterized protein PFLUO_LOCUS5416 [Penicillium psychrofluorescens]|uniref:uncharacterized protein n=1 Tax=Penicillium psychrofluorescens TaxID=3158075 RepID=UPI003CCE204A